MVAQDRSGTHAVVIGGSIAGLVTAKVLSTQFEQVTVLDRDQLPELAEYRQGVPQSHHVHVLLRRGAEILEELFPNITTELAEAEASYFDLSADVRSELRGRWMPRQETGILGLNCSRVLLESTIRRQLAATQNVTICSGGDVTRLLTNERGETVTGVEVNWRRHSGRQGVERIAADWVVDASGRSSKTPKWLEGIGFEAPEETVVNAKLGYSTRRYQGIGPVDWHVMFVFCNPGVKTRGGGIMREEGDNWVVTLSGFDDYPPTDEVGFMAFAQDVGKEFYEVIKDAEPISSIAGYRRTENRWRHYDRLRQWPERFVALGDAVCAFNPIYGQGMTMAALTAQTLGEVLTQEAHDTVGLAHKFQKRLPTIISPMWFLATSEDYRWPTTEGGSPNLVMRLGYQYLDDLQHLCFDYPDMIHAFVSVQHMLEPTTMLFHPKFLWAVLKRRMGLMRSKETVSVAQAI